MTLVLQIALGIVLAYLVLCYLPSIVSVGVIAIAIVAALAIGSLMLYWLLGSPVMLSIGLFAIVCYLTIRPFIPKIEEYYRLKVLRRSILRRERLGYETTALQLQLAAELSAIASRKPANAKPFVPIWLRLFGSAAEKERARRKALGYRDSAEG